VNCRHRNGRTYPDQTHQHTHQHDTVPFLVHHRPSAGLQRHCVQNNRKRLFFHPFPCTAATERLSATHCGITFLVNQYSAQH